MFRSILHRLFGKKDSRPQLLEKFKEGILVQDSNGNSWRAILVGIDGEPPLFPVRICLTQNVSTPQPDLVKDSLTCEQSGKFPSNEFPSVTLLMTYDSRASVDESIKSLQETARITIDNL